MHARPDLLAGVRHRDRLRLAFDYRADAALGDALVQVNMQGPPGWRHYPLPPLRSTHGRWVPYTAEFTVDVVPNGGGEVQLRGTTGRSGDQVVLFDDVTLQVVGTDAEPGPRPFPEPKGAKMILPSHLRAIEADLTRPPLHTAAEELRRFLEERLVTPDPRPSPPVGHRIGIRPGTGSEPGVGALALGTPDGHPALARWMAERGARVAASEERDDYAILAREGRIGVLGANPRAALYGAYRLEDLLAVRGGLPDGFVERGAPALAHRLLHPRVRGGFHSYRQSDFEFTARCGGNVAHLSHDWMGEKTLFSFVACPEFPEAADPAALARNREALRRYLDWCKPYGLRAALWFCEVVCQGGPWVPEASRQAFLKSFPPECLSETGTYQGKVLCLAHPLVEQAYRGMARRLVTDFPELEMALLFSIDSNGELCDPSECRRHQGVSKLEQYHRLLALLQEECAKARPGFRVFSIGWGWHFRGDPAFLEGQGGLPAGIGLTSPPDGEAWSFDRKLTDDLVAYRRVTRERGQLFLGYDILLWGDDTVFPETELYDFPLGVAAKLRRWAGLGADGVFDQWGTQAEYVQSNAIALSRLFFQPDLAEPEQAEDLARTLAAEQYGPAGEHVFTAWQEIEAAQRIQSEHTYYWHHLRPGWAGATRSCALTLEALREVKLQGGEPPKPYRGVNQAPHHDDTARAEALGPALARAADHFASAAGHLRRTLETLPEGYRSAYEHWYADSPGAPLRLTPRQQLEKEWVAVRLQEKVQRRFSRFFTAYALVRTLPAEGVPGRQEALVRLEALRDEEARAAAEP